VTGLDGRICPGYTQIPFPSKDKPRSSSRRSRIGCLVRYNEVALSCVHGGDLAAVIEGTVSVECQGVSQAGISDDGGDRVDAGSVVVVDYPLQSGHDDAC